METVKQNGIDSDDNVISSNVQNEHNRTEIESCFEILRFVSNENMSLSVLVCLK